MRRICLILALGAPACGPGNKTSATEGTGSTSGTGTGTGTGSTSSTSDITGTGSTGALTDTASTTPTTGTGTTGVLPDGKCRTAADCEDFEQCEPPGAVSCGGDTGCALVGTECVDDAVCGGTPESPQICVTDPCCALGRCQPGCLADSDCGLAQHCGPDARCAAASCDANAPCPANFSCTADLCAPTACSGDGECDGYCLNGRCSAEAGNCVAPAP